MLPFDEIFFAPVLKMACKIQKHNHNAVIWRIFIIIFSDIPYINALHWFDEFLKTIFREIENETIFTSFLYFFQWYSTQAAACDGKLSQTVDVAAFTGTKNFDGDEVRG